MIILISNSYVWENYILYSQLANPSFSVRKQNQFLPTKGCFQCSSQNLTDFSQNTKPHVTNKTSNQKIIGHPSSKSFIIYSLLYSLIWEKDATCSLEERKDLFMQDFFSFTCIMVKDSLSNILRRSLLFISLFS